MIKKKNKGKKLEILVSVDEESTNKTFLPVTIYLFLCFVEAKKKTTFVLNIYIYTCTIYTIKANLSAHRNRYGNKKQGTRSHLYARP